MLARTLSLTLAALVVVLAAACGRSPRTSGPVDDGPTPVVIASTAIPTQSGPPVIRTSLDGDCRLTPFAAQIRVEFTATAFGSAVLTRVRLLQDGREVDDSGVLEQRAYHRVATFDAEPGSQHTYRLVTESQAGAGPGVQRTVVCGRSPTPSPGPRA